ncbi:hypothetical protein [Collinsella ihumii]|uniref:hypothetical protein n=1 Tax=Collinsella ihumii TaxID=1720204 RepID=UPI000832B92E|nr:hypothetical protein [Collinsella ihumii]
MQTWILALVGVLLVICIVLCVLLIWVLLVLKQVDWRLNVIDGKLIAIDSHSNGQNGEHPKRNDTQREANRGTTPRSGSAAARKQAIEQAQHEPKTNNQYVDPRPDVVLREGGSVQTAQKDVRTSRIIRRGGKPIYDKKTDSIVIETISK